MASEKHTISLGFTGQTFAPGVHICQIFSDDDERQEALLKFLVSGLEHHERTACFSESLKEEAAEELLDNYGISYADAKASGALTLSGVRNIYFSGNEFNPERMLGLLRDFHVESIAQGYPAARVIGEMLPEVHDLPGGSRLMEYESRVSLLLRDNPISAVCQYDSRLFDGATIMDVLKVHPLMVVRGAVVRNPFFIPPEEFLHADKGAPA